MKIHPAIIPLTIVGLILAGVFASSLLVFPSYSVVFSDITSNSQDSVSTNFTVEGVRCVDTAARAAQTLKELDGVGSVTAYASKNSMVVLYDNKKISPEKIIKVIEGPIFDTETGTYLLHQFKVLEIDNLKVDH